MNRRNFLAILGITPASSVILPWSKLFTKYPYLGYVEYLDWNNNIIRKKAYIIGCDLGVTKTINNVYYTIAHIPTKSVIGNFPNKEISIKLANFVLEDTIKEQTIESLHSNKKEIARQGFPIKSLIKMQPYEEPNNNITNYLKEKYGIIV